MDQKYIDNDNMHNHHNIIQLLHYIVFDTIYNMNHILNLIINKMMKIQISRAKQQQIYSFFKIKMTTLVAVLR